MSLLPHPLGRQTCVYIYICIICSLIMYLYTHIFIYCWISLSPSLSIATPYHNLLYFHLCKPFSSNKKHGSHYLQSISSFTQSLYVSSFWATPSDVLTPGLTIRSSFLSSALSSLSFQLPRPPTTSKGREGNKERREEEKKEETIFYFLKTLKTKKYLELS